MIMEVHITTIWATKVTQAMSNLSNFDSLFYFLMSHA
jgi:hypothetical protein